MSFDFNVNNLLLPQSQHLGGGPTPASGPQPPTPGTVFSNNGGSGQGQNGGNGSVPQPVFTPNLQNNNTTGAHNRADPTATGMMVDSLCSRLQLTPAYAKDLNSFAKFGSSLSTGDLLLRLYTQAMLFKVLMLVAPQSENQVVILARLKQVQDELERGWRLTDDQEKNIRLVVKDIIFEAKRSNFTSLHIPVMERLRAEKDVLGFKTVFGNLARETLLLSHVRITCSSIRNNFRAEIRDGIYKHKSTLVAFTKKMADRFILGGPTAPITEATQYALKCALLRHFAMENKELLISKKRGKKAKGQEDEDPGEADTRGTTAEPSTETVNGSNKRKLDDEPEEDHWWAAVEKWLEGKNKLQGTSWTSPIWRAEFSGIVNADVARFGGETIMANTPFLPLGAPAPTQEAMPDLGSGSAEGVLTDIFELALGAASNAGSF